MLARRLEPGVSALGDAYTFGSCVLHEPCARTRLEHLPSDLVLKFERLLLIIKTLASASLGQQLIAVIF